MRGRRNEGEPGIGRKPNGELSWGPRNSNRKRFAVRRIVGAGELWVTEYVLSYDGRLSYTVSIMEFLEGKVARETQYFGDPFEPGVSRAEWVEPIGGGEWGTGMASP